MADDADSAQLSIKVVSSGSETLAVHVPNFATATVRALKTLVEAQDARRFPVAAQRLIFQGQILQDDRLLRDYSVASGCALHLTLTPGAVAQATPAAAPGVAPPTAVFETQLLALLQRMRADAGFVVAVQTLLKICENVEQQPHEAKFRKLRLANAALRSRLLDRPHGVECAKLLGFLEGVEEGHLVLVPTAEKWENLVAGRRLLAQALAAAGGSSAAASSAAAAPSAFGATPGAMNASWASQAQSVLQNPMMAQMLQNDPMVRQMAQANPMLAQALQNPAMLSQQLQMLQQNPAMMQQVTQMMQDPSAMARMQQMMGGGGLSAGLGASLGGGFGASPFGAPAAAAQAANPFAPSAPSNPFASSSATASSTPAPAPAPSATPASAPAAASTPATASTLSAAATFDEDEIAEAIARSLQDQS
ncbi:hypothetical protein PybrP1_004062 [[Pythium] brassicae (nom. inval.)]|nr:hypothetical protein PybrP1_004062 [[Pythium] brassicae (nom. inval.)]